ncbi:hypothetical protein CLCR_07724 [Cladophialophora carrionii]|uniref:Uncharacterized protein n=1 Tax=Cladophialophora carrionii TaxID=86049 RepID=A0A1C1CPM7_9EURO|nr:hypothetical protein CLCR_07724 [Cladophialophora carrionii]
MIVEAQDEKRREDAGQGLETRLTGDGSVADQENGNTVTVTAIETGPERGIGIGTGTGIGIEAGDTEMRTGRAGARGVGAATGTEIPRVCTTYLQGVDALAHTIQITEANAPFDIHAQGLPRETVAAHRSGHGPLSAEAIMTGTEHETGR